MSEGIAFIANGSFSLVSFIVALSIIVFIHEFGHYIVGRWCGIDAEVFSIGFGPVLLSRKDKHGTMWQIALLPLGGFVKFSREETNCQATKENFVNFNEVLNNSSLDENFERTWLMDSPDLTSIILVPYTGISSI